MIFQTFHNGINLGGWLSQYEFLTGQPLTDINLKRHFEGNLTAGECSCSPDRIVQTSEGIWKSK